MLGFAHDLEDGMLKWIFRAFMVGVLSSMSGGALALAGRFSWWLALVLGIGIYVAGGWLLRFLARRAVYAPLKIKGQVLQGAKLRTHSVRPADPPERSPEDDLQATNPTTEETPNPANAEDAPDEEEDGWDDEVPKLYYRLDLTITPTAPPGKMRLWEPAELLLVPFDNTDDPEAIATSGDTGYMEEVEIYENGRWVEDEPGKYEGERRVRLLVAAPETLRTTKLRYYFESFGRIQLPKHPKR